MPTRYQQLMQLMDDFIALEQENIFTFEEMNNLLVELFVIFISFGELSINLKEEKHE